MTSITLTPLPILPEIKSGDNLPQHIASALAKAKLELRSNDILVVAQKVVSKAEGAMVDLPTIRPSPKAQAWAQRWQKDPRLIEVVLRESKHVLKMERGVIICQTRHGFICANAGVDLSNSGGVDRAVLLPAHPNRSARHLRQALEQRQGVAPGIIIADSFGRPWRTGLTQVALGLAGFTPLRDLRGHTDSEGRPLASTLIAEADELACAADLVTGKTSRRPVVLIRGYQPPPPAQELPSGKTLLRIPELDLFR